MDYLSIATEALEREAPEDLSDLSALSHPAEPYEGALADYLYPFQQAGVQYIAKARQVLLGDEMGLGKTPMAIAALLNDGAADYESPALVLCPPSLTANWRREVEALSDLTVYVAKGLTPTDAEVAEAMAADVVVAGYSVLRTEQVIREVKGEAETITVPTGWAKGLRWNISALVCDESHYLKNYKAQRTEAATMLADGLDGDALRILLTGTPVLNRPNELVSQIQILDRLPDTGYHKSFNWLKYYCNGRQNRYGWDFSGASNISALNDRMRSAFYVRRVKTNPEVAKQIGVGADNKRPAIKVSLDLNGALDKYNRAADDIIAFAHEHGGPKAAWAASRAEVLVRLNALRKLAGEAKVEAAVEWVQNWLDSNPDRKIVVFATYTDVQHALVEAFDAPAILGGQDAEATETEKKRFNEGDARVIVVSLAAGREGHTLVAGGACSDVVFVEQGWTPAEHQQAEDRVNRIGQTEVVTPWYLLGAEVDHAIRELVEAKQVVTDAVANGADASAEEGIAQAAFYRIAV